MRPSIQTPVPSRNNNNNNENGKTSRAPEAHSCNPSYSGGRDQEDHSLKPAQANSYRDPILKYLIQKGLVEWLKE
jgi:hypothetical protein